MVKLPNTVAPQIFSLVAAGGDGEGFYSGYPCHSAMPDPPAVPARPDTFKWIRGAHLYARDVAHHNTARSSACGELLLSRVMLAAATSQRLAGAGSGVGPPPPSGGSREA